ncbi:MAG: Co2+/Mg2+ efflux protein ApaG [Thiotrichales bacterium]|nr:Co2+/Mg2+ efflux protein ApaG [Thiotrichales bacterium]MCY4283742.1 Co2+/Mg2+ efflux protein ApaG [Thiotrichales bacterium]
MDTNDDHYRIVVDAKSTYVPEHSSPDEGRYVFAYTVTIRNTGAVAAKLRTRHWIITDANGRAQEVRGDGVVGEQPHLAPGEAFRYTSAAIIKTPVGSMYGSYQMVADDGYRFDAPIAAFSLSVPNVVH